MNNSACIVACCVAFLATVVVTRENAWLCVGTIFFGFAFAVVFLIVECCKSRTGGLYEAVRATEFRANVRPLNTTFTINPSRGPDELGSPGYRSFGQNGVVITSDYLIKPIS